MAINLDLPPILIAYLSYMDTIQNKSSNTIEGYKLDLILFFRFLKLSKNNLPLNTDIKDVCIKDIDENFLKSISLIDIYNFLDYIKNYRDNCSNTRARKVAVLKSFFNYLKNKVKIIELNPTKNLETPKRPKRQPVYLSLKESEMLLDAVKIKNGRNKERDYAIITLFLNCGLRLSELCNIKLSYIRNDTLIITGKGDKQRTIYLNNSCLKAINEYLNVRNKLKNIKDKDSDYLFLSERKQKINKRSVQRIVQKFIEYAGLDKKYTVHKLRHTAATLLYKYGEVDIRNLQVILGHENISTTTIYTHVDKDELRSALKSNPLNNKRNNF
ncbi:tyrosine recombinase XerC [Clostridium botulinum]|uniref:tyrosine recombinase XerC n=1 Tax=Clostridium botulinum TaxID=1491 RepID=UPI00016BBB6C|nr:tyrosine recombinase XerC [Clostridium botulinum]EDT83779.1 tyrosine recombinase [Clostridium botulinum Bf]MBY6882554.1 tyrosine recombinase XerC [Clostridium botulinum]NEZ88380.1 tyrosine recombinase XerC [Clostridium botulinum]NFB02789.1 tyrosine recombinase XerC [Clostridium botulinum]NFE32731.1 tyrosine recombinase XerC [Clostridium botulinum]